MKLWKGDLLVNIFKFTQDIFSIYSQSKDMADSHNLHYCLTTCLCAKCCNLIGWVMERGPSIHFLIDGPDRLYGF